jgi:hypothetical protein
VGNTIIEGFIMKTLAIRKKAVAATLMVMGLFVVAPPQKAQAGDCSTGFGVCSIKLGVGVDPDGHVKIEITAEIGVKP